MSIGTTNRTLLADLVREETHLTLAPTESLRKSPNGYQQQYSKIQHIHRNRINVHYQLFSTSLRRKAEGAENERK